jgi:cell division protein ZapA (FtsZ GTPase activity inhibitor)
MREIDLEIAGQRLHIRTDEDESYMRGLAAFVDEQMREIGKGQQRGIASLTIALLAALRIADDYHKLQALGQSVESSLESLAEAVEACLETSPGR